MSRFSPRLKDDILEVLFTEEQVRQRVKELGEQISKDFEGKPLTLVGILRGALVFLSDLSRSVQIPHSFDMAGASSYGSAVSSSGRVQITKDVEVNLRDRHVIICEDIYDSGRTLAAIRDLLHVHRPAEIRIATFLYKEVPKRVLETEIDYVGFKIPDKFVVGYGLDFAEHYRNLPYVGVLNPRVYEKGAGNDV